MTASCPDRLLLDDYIAGKSSAQSHGDFESHIRRCRECQARLSQFNPTEDSLMRVLREVVLADGQPAVGSSPELSSAMASIAARLGKPPGTVNGDPSSAGRVIRDYELKKKLGEGGMGAVYLALHTRLKKQVAVKLLKADRSGYAPAIARFAVEMEAVGKLDHPNIVRALDAGEENGIHFLVMEYLPGIDLARLIRGLGPLSVADTCEIVRQAALGLHHAHESDITHRDVKPSNFILLPTGKVKVLDLGLAHLRPALHESVGLTEENQVLGTLLYVAPEQFSASGKVDSRSDIYSLGVTLYELLLGRMPSRQNMVVSPTPEELAERSDVPPEIWQIAIKMTSVNREDRPGSMLEVADSARPFAGGANLGNLFQQVLGLSAFEAPPPIPTPPASDGTVGGVSGNSGSPPAWPPVYVSPPPLSSSVAYDNMSVEPRQRERSIWTTAAAAILTPLCLLLAYLLVINWPRSSPKPLPLPIPQASISIQGSEAYRGVVGPLLSEGSIKIVPQPGNAAEQQQLHTGENEIPPGDWILQGSDSWQRLTFTPLEFTVSDAASVTLRPKVKFTFPSWRFPELPTQSHAFCVWSGSLWNARMGAPPELSKVPFELTLSAHDTKLIDGRKHRWLKVTIDDRKHKLIETGWFLIDVQQWQDLQKFAYAEAWVHLSTSELTEALKTEFETEPPDALVVAFDDQKDSLFNAAGRLGVHLPEDRLSVFHALVLIFNAPLSGAPDWIRQVRESLPAAHEYSLESIEVPGGEAAGVVVRAGPKTEADDESKETSPAEPAVSLLLERSREVPFSFGRIDVNSDYFQGHIKMISCSRPDQSAIAEQPPLLDWTKVAKQIADLPARPHPIDMADLPDDGQGSVYSGSVTSPLGKLPIDFELRMRGSVMILGKPHRWLEVTAASGDHEEQVLLCIDEQAYLDGEFRIKHGWFLLGDDVFSYSHDGDLSGIEETLLRLDKQLPAIRFGVHDVLSLMFDAKMAESSFKNTRNLLRGERLAGLLERSHTRGRFTLLGETYHTDKWELPAPATNANSYKLERARRLPFNFTSATIAFDGKVFAAELQRITEGSSLATPDQVELAGLEKKTAERAARIKPNWKLWTVGGTTSRIWAEYVGSYSDGVATKVVLRGDDFPEVRFLELHGFKNEDDLAAIDRGRQWLSRSGEEMFWGEFVKSDKKGLYFEVAGKSAPVVHQLADFSKRDQQCIELLKSVIHSETEKPRPPRR